MTEELIDYGSVNSRVGAFDKKHGKCVYHDGWLRFEDGAYRESNPLGLMVEPPDDCYDRAKRIATYFKIIFDRAFREFNAAKDQFASIAKNNLNSSICGSPPAVEDVTRELTALKARAVAAKANYDKALKGVEAVKPAHYRMREEARIENIERNQELLAAIRGIEL